MILQAWKVKELQDQLTTRFTEESLEVQAMCSWESNIWGCESEAEISVEMQIWRSQMSNKNHINKETEAMSDTSSITRKPMPLKPIKDHIFALSARHCATVYNYCYAEFWVWFFPSPYLPFGMKIFNLWHFVTTVWNLFFYFFGGSLLRVCIELSRKF